MKTKGILNPDFYITAFYGTYEEGRWRKELTVKKMLKIERLCRLGIKPYEK